MAGFLILHSGSVSEKIAPADSLGVSEEPMNRFYALLLCKFVRLTAQILIFTVIFCPATFGKYSGGTGEPNDPFLIATPNDLNSIGSDSNDWDKHFLMTVDINMAEYTGSQFNIIGNDVNAFTGVFDGNGYAISNFTWNSAYSDYVGLFGCVGSVFLSYDPNAKIKDLKLVDPNIQGRWYVGALVGKLTDGMVTGCGVEGGAVFGDDVVGGLVGLDSKKILKGTISNCYATCSVSGDEKVGGLVGTNYGTISNCYANGSVYGNYLVGGLVGRNTSDSTISNCYAVGAVSGEDKVGGLVGGGTSYSVFSSYWDIQTSGQSVSSGGHGKTTAQMKMASTFLAWGGCGNYWTIDEGNDYPRLAWQRLPGTPLPELELADYLQGSGQTHDPYLISNAQELNLIGLFPCELDKHFKLTADINLIDYNETNFKIIGNEDYPFTGVFDGDNHIISNFIWYSPISISSYYEGLFGYVFGLNAEVKNLRLIDSNIQGSYYVGALIGELRDGTVTYCSIEGGTASGFQNVGGLVGHSYYGIISNCHAAGDVTGIYESSKVGGLVGYNNGTISNCYAAGSVSGRSNFGGLVGVNYDTISNCYTTSSVSGR